MSWNRGAALLNCVKHTGICAPGMEMWIFDDGSTDPETKKFLNQLERTHRVIRQNASARSMGTHGGLYKNMNTALETAIQAGFKYLFIVQDDQQIVRPLSKNFWQELNEIFESDPSILQVSPTFFKGYLPNRVRAECFRLMRKPDYYLNLTNSCSDTGILNLAVVQRSQFKFGNTEVNSSVSAGAMGLKLAHAKNPVYMYNPWPKFDRKIRHPLIRFLAWLNLKGVNSGSHPFEIMSQTEVQALESRSIEEYPIPEKFLKTKTKLIQPWFYSYPFDLDKIKGFRKFLSMGWMKTGASDYIRYAKEVASEKKNLPENNK